MFCYQCEQTQFDNGIAACTGTRGACGKDAPTSDLQDVLIHLCKAIAQYTSRARKLGASDIAIDRFQMFAVFTTLTNVNFDADKFVSWIGEAAAMRAKAKALYEAAAAAKGVTADVLSGPAVFAPAANKDGLLAQAKEAAVNHKVETFGADAIGLRALLLYALKGVAAYGHHASVLGEEREAVFVGIERALDQLASDNADLGSLLEEALEIGRVNFAAMEALDKGNTTLFGTPAPTAVRIAPVKGKAILVSGHDLKDLLAILKATEGKGINVYTHGEMLPAHGYPNLKAFAHLAGNYGGAWQEQQFEFADFPGPVVLTSNCLIKPQKKYSERLWTLGPVGWPGIKHLDGDDYTAIVEQALALPGFEEDGDDKTILVGFGRDAVLGVADKVIDAVKAGAIKHFFLVGGCDGAKTGRNYFTEFADNAPKDTVILTLGCGKYRFNKHDFGTIGGLPRLLDIGQCNDAYSALIIATKLAEAFGCGVNDLPLSLIVSWFEQKAAAILCTLLALGVRHIKLGPTLPAFLTPALVGVLVEKFGISGVGEDAKADIAQCMTRAA
jgi:hydroxylamine reductase